MKSTRLVLQQELRRLRHFAYSLTANMDEADDLVQDVVVKVLDKGIPEEVNPMPWLITLTKNLWVDKLRHKQVRTRPENADMVPLPQEDFDPVQNLEGHDILEALKQMPEDVRLVLSLVSIEGHSYKEVASITGIPIGTVMSRMSRARKMMITKLNYEGGYEH